MHTYIWYMNCVHHANRNAYRSKTLSYLISVPVYRNQHTQYKQRLGTVKELYSKENAVGSE